MINIIKAEISRLKNTAENQGAYNVLCELDAFLDSLPKTNEEEEEKVASGYAWSHDTVGIPGSTKRIPVGDEIKTAVLFGMRWMKRKYNEISV